MIVNTLKPSKSVGFDDIQTNIIKKSIHLIATPLLHAINLSLAQGIFPEELKKSVVKPLFKTGDKSKTENYRPITLVPIFSKIYERVMFSRLEKFLNKNNVIAEEQNGFRKKRSTSLAAFKLIKKIMNCIDRNIPVTVLFMDMSKAFDFVCHNRLLMKLSKYGIRGPAFEWIKSYLSNRTQCVETSKYCPLSRTVHVYQSSYIENSYGVPQGSILGPLLFLLYINDLPNYLSHECVLFADDTSIVIESKDLTTYNDEINRTLTKTITWLSENNLKVNLSKTKYVQFHTNRAMPQVLTVSHENETLEEVSKTKFLGLNLDCHCSWKYHVHNLCSKINRFVYAIRKVSRVVSLKAALAAYNGYIDSTLRYGIVLWGNSVNIDNIFIVQKRCIRAIFGISQLDSCRPYFQKYNILPLPCLYIFEICLFVYKNHHLFQLQKDITKRAIRSQYIKKLYRPPIRLTLVSKNSYMMCIDIFNKLPDSFKNYTDGIIIFKKHVKTWLLKHCFYSLKEFIDLK